MGLIPPSLFHHLAPVGVHAADQGLGHHVLAVGNVAPAHLHQGAVFGLLFEALLRPLDHLAIVGRHKARRAEQIGLGEAALRHLGAVVFEAECVHTKSKEPVPCGWMCRIDTLLTCCWMIRLGNTVVITAVGPPHQGSGTMSSRRGSFSCMLSLKLSTPATTSATPLAVCPPWPRVE